MTHSETPHSKFSATTMTDISSLSRSAAMALRRTRQNRTAPGRAASDRGNTRPMSEMNVTPFIDVLLVLLIMMIIAIPVAVQKLNVNLPTTSCVNCPVNLESNTVSITPGDQLLWNGEVVTRSRLKASIAKASALPEVPLLRFEPAPEVSYDTSAKTIALIKSAGGEKMAFSGASQYRQFGR